MLSTPLQRRQALVFVLGWLAYAATYLLRKPLGVVKADLETELSVSKTELGWLDTALLLPYAVMQMLLGPLGDKFGARKTFGVCLLLSAVSMFSFGHWSNIYIFMLLLFLNGTAQAQCWPNCTKSLGAWYPDNVRNIVFGVFGTCTFAGGIIGTALAVYLQTTHGWRSVFLTPSIIVAVIGVLVLLFLQQPNEVDIEVPGKAVDSSSENSKSSSSVPWLELFKIPMIPEVAVAVFTLKIIRYCMYMWLPMYLLHQLNYSKAQAGMFSTVFEIGGVLGSAAIGFIIDRFFKGQSLVGTGYFAFLSAISLVFFHITSSWGIIFNAIFLFLSGVFNCGPDSILGGSIPAELGEMNGRNAAAATVGLVNGFGTVGTFLEGPIIGFISTHYGWSGMFIVMIGLSFVGTLAILKAAYMKGRLNSSVSDIQEEIPLKMEDV